MRQRTPRSRSGSSPSAATAPIGASVRCRNRHNITGLDFEIRGRLSTPRDTPTWRATRRALERQSNFLRTLCRPSWYAVRYIHLARAFSWSMEIVMKRRFVLGRAATRDSFIDPRELDVNVDAPRMAAHARREYCAVKTLPGSMDCRLVTEQTNSRSTTCSSGC